MPSEVAASSKARSPLPSVDALLREPAIRGLVERFGHTAVVGCLRENLEQARAALRRDGEAHFALERFVAACVAAMDRAAERSLRPMFNLTGTVLHTNLGRAVLAEEAVAAATEAMRGPVNLEFDVAAGKRGERDEHVAGLICRLTGAEAATVVNNNAAAIFLVLNTLAAGREAIVSRGEQIEIGGAFRLPDIMARAGCRLREIGTTNRTHLRDYESAIGPDTGLLLKAHTSNYVVQGFVASVDGRELAALAKEKAVPFVEDLGSGTLVDLESYGLPHEPTAREAIAAGVDVVTFSGDKLLGGPQAGIIVGRRRYLAEINRNPLKRALRVDKVRLAALEATLRLYLDPDRLAARLPTLRLLCRPVAELRALAQSLLPALETAVGPAFAVSIVACRSQIGSGALPLEAMPSAALRIEPSAARASGSLVADLAAAFRRLAVPVIGRIEDGGLIFDLRCLEDADGFAAQLSRLRVTA